MIGIARPRDQQGRQRIGEMRIGEDVAGHKLADSDRHQIGIAADQRIGGGVGAHRVGEEEDEAADQRGRQDRQADPPARRRGRRRPSEGRLRGFRRVMAPERREKQQQPELDLKIGKDKHEPACRIDVELAHHPEADQQKREEPRNAEHDDEREGDRKSGEVRPDIGIGENEAGARRGACAAGTTATGRATTTPIKAVAVESSKLVTKALR